MMKKKSKFNLPNNLKPVLTASTANLDVQYIAERDTKAKLLSDEQNNFHFYDIQQIDPSRVSKLKPNSNFKSMHVLSDMALIKGTKFY